MTRAATPGSPGPTGRISCCSPTRTARCGTGGRSPRRARSSPRSRGSRGPYLIQAAIASLQTADPIDWRQIAALYAELAELTGSPVVRLNGAVAVAQADGPGAALAIVDGLDLPGYQYWHSTRAELLRRLGRADEARAAYRDALALAGTEPERRFLLGRIAEVDGAG